MLVWLFMTPCGTSLLRGQATDIEIHAREILKLKDKLNRILSENTGRPYEEVVQATERDNYLTPEEARDFGLIDRILVSRRDAIKKKDK